MLAIVYVDGIEKTDALKPLAQRLGQTILPVNPQQREVKAEVRRCETFANAPC